MKPLIRLFFRGVRLVAAPIVLTGYALARPKALQRAPEAQAAVDARTAKLALYHFPTCPFCLKTRNEIHRLALKIELRDARNDATHRVALEAGGGKIQTPCLRIDADDGTTSWMYESGEIMAYLQQEFGLT